MIVNDEDEVAELREAAREEGSELGEFWRLMCDLNAYSYFFSKKFAAAYRAEMASILKQFKNDFEFVEEEYQPPKQKRRVLRAKG